MSVRIKTLRAAFPHTIPILTSYLMVGMAYGIYAGSMGLPAWFPTIMSITIFGGSMEFVTVNLLTGPFDPLGAFFMAVMINARYFFYGISMLERFRGLGKRKLYMIYAQCDETFSINCSIDPPEGIARGDFMLAVTLLNQCYWVIGATLGGFVGAALSFDSRGIDFLLTALYITIFLEQWLNTKEHVPGITGLTVSVGMLIILGADHFVLPALIAILIVLLLLRGRLDKAEGGRNT
ncbi:AzlC family ABC transporter permease [Christensenellaceae bacterium OttesenSCG-928-L17]|nr:AzlC family ABC transporter permease [Christensenellaceae bacterium OttesenSCG-928-L17]